MTIKMIWSCDHIQIAQNIMKLGIWVEMYNLISCFVAAAIRVFLSCCLL